MSKTNAEAEQALCLSKLQGSEGPALFFKNVLNVVSLEAYQEFKILKAIAENDRVAITACHDVGKTFTMARIALWFNSVFPNSKVITTAPTFNQVKNIFWSEMRAAYERSAVPLGGKMNQTDWRLGPEWFGIGFTPKAEAGNGTDGQGTASSFQGFHAPWILIIFDEATGISKLIWDMAEGLMTSHNVKFVAIGNPTSTASEFFKKCRSPFWFKVRLTCFDSPNLIANGMTSKEALRKEVAKVKGMKDVDKLERLKSYKVTRPYLLTTRWVVEKLIEWGFDHPLAVSKIFGEFPEDGDNTLISLGAVEAAKLRIYYPSSSDRKIVGIDVARFGADSTVITLMHGKKVVGYKKINKKRGYEVADEATAFAFEVFGSKPDIYVVDETGLGSGVVDELHKQTTKRGERIYGVNVRGVQFGAKCTTKTDKEKWSSLKAKMFGLLGEDMHAEDGSIQLLDESIYDEELPTIRKKYETGGALSIESKDDYKKRTGNSSPDSADSLALANYGNYEELTAGKMGESFKPKTDGRPLATRLADNKQW